jgi:hypothetical protein
MLGAIPFLDGSGTPFPLRLLGQLPFFHPKISGRGFLKTWPHHIGLQRA